MSPGNRKIIIVFGVAFILNFIWECLHSFLYASYQGDVITIFILFRATIFDALLITVFYLLFSRVNFFKTRPWLILFIALFLAVGIEIYALNTGRWAYNNLMPVIPFLNVGLTPTIQLAILSYLTFKLSNLWDSRKS